ncbi:MAG TPA: transcriptional regulator CynR [Burkholderiales bacterium]|nr:transcriptional regulator CynR [Burkholderiales bacterium]
MELRHLHYFLKIAETSSFTLAAASLHVTQPTLSHQIRQLEQEVGRPLFDRVGRGVRLTEPGKILRDYARRAIQEVRSGLQAVVEIDGLVRGALAVGVFRTYSSSPLPDVLAQFSRRHPGVEVTVRQLSLRDIERELVEGRIHMGIGYLPITSDRLVVDPLFAVPLALVASRRHPLFRRRKISIRDLQDQPLVLLGREFPLRQLIDRRLAHHGVTPRVVMEMNANDAVLSTVRAGALATILTERKLRDSENLRSIPIDDPQLARNAAILWSRDAYRPAAARALAELVKRAYADASRASRRRRSAA